MPDSSFFDPIMLIGGAPIQAAAPPPPPFNTTAGFQIYNPYGSSFQTGYNTSGAITGNALVNLGAAEANRRLELSGRYNPATSDWSAGVDLRFGPKRVVPQGGYGPGGVGFRVGGTKDPSITPTFAGPQGDIDSGLYQGIPGTYPVGAGGPPRAWSPQVGPNGAVLGATKQPVDSKVFLNKMSQPIINKLLEDAAGGPQNNNTPSQPQSTSGGDPYSLFQGRTSLDYAQTKPNDEDTTKMFYGPWGGAMNLVR